MVVIPLPDIIEFDPADPFAPDPLEAPDPPEPTVIV